MLSICFPYPDENEEIKKVFLEFLEREMITGSEIGNTILICFSFFFDKKGIDIKNLRANAMTGYPIRNQKKLLQALQF